MFNILLGMFVSKCNTIKALKYGGIPWEGLVCPGCQRNSILFTKWAQEIIAPLHLIICMWQSETLRMKRQQKMCFFFYNYIPGQNIVKFKLDNFHFQFRSDKTFEPYCNSNSLSNFTSMSIKAPLTSFPLYCVFLFRKFHLMSLKLAGSWKQLTKPTQAPWQ